MKNALLSIVASLVCIVIGLLVGFIILYCINAENAVDGFTRIIKGGFYLKPKGIGSEIAQSAPLIMTGLSVAFAFKTGLFNIGAEGQFIADKYPEDSIRMDQAINTVHRRCLRRPVFCHHPPHAMVCMPSGCYGLRSHLGSSSWYLQSILQRK